MLLGHCSTIISPILILNSLGLQLIQIRYTTIFYDNQTKLGLSASSLLPFSSDVAVAQILEALNKDSNFIIEILDNTHLFVDGRKIDDALKQLEEILEQNTYRAADD
ncbi:hypothetical protein HDU97_009825 [Phlyctochytrium planicorne]|nr:hypothetical protein HDU97_009825 [Phlyctochytrium planicorne]